MDQLTPAWRRDYERLNPPHDLPYWLGKVLMAPTESMPTQEDYQAWLEEQVRQDPDAIQPVDTGETREMRQDRTAREVGQAPLDYLTMAHGIASLLKGGTGAAQELMGKRRGVETFGKEMMDTSRRAQSRKWQEMEGERWRAAHEPESGLPTGRKSYEDEIRTRGTLANPPLAPGENPQWRRGEMKPADLVERVPAGEITYRNSFGETLPFEREVYRIGEMVSLPGGRQAQYVVMPSQLGYHVALYDGEQVRLIETFGGGMVHAAANTSMGEALAKARQLQNRLALAAQDLGRYDPQDAITGRLMYSAGPAAQGPRRVRLPWERGTSFGEGPDWPRDYSEPPGSGRWSK